jgi:hypothetical protein
MAVAACLVLFPALPRLCLASHKFAVSAGRTVRADREFDLAIQRAPKVSKACMRGIIYSAIGAQYVREAVTSATSSIRFNQIPHLIFCDVPADAQIAGLEYRQFYSCGNPFLDKINNIRHTPFTETMFLDTDTYVLGNLDDLFDLLKRFDLASTPASSPIACLRMSWRY